MTQARDLADNKLTGDVEIDGTTLTVDSTNNRVGVGTASPDYQIDIEASSPTARLNSTVDNGVNTIWFGHSDDADAGAIRYWGSAGGLGTYANAMTFNTNGDQAMHIDNNGTVGIGVTPSSWKAGYGVIQLGSGNALWGGGATGPSYFSVSTNYYYNNATEYRYLNNGHASDFYQNAGTFTWRTAGSGTAGDVISFSTVATLNSSGFTGAFGSSGNLSLSNELSGYSGGVYPTLKSSGGSIYFDALNTYTGYISYNTGFTDISDERDKDNIVTIDNALDKVSQLRGVYHTWKDNRDEGKRHTGLIAQEVNEVMTEVVTEGADKYGVNYGKLVGVLIEAIKELKTENENLKARVEALESN